jgi:protease I
MNKQLNGVKVAILVADGFEEVELLEPKKALEQAGAKVQVISPAKGQVQGWHHTEKADKIPVDVQLEQANPGEYNALLLPGGVINPDNLRLIPDAIKFIKAIADAGKPIAAICHGPWPLINAGVVKGRKVTSWPSLQVDLTNAGAHWVDEQVVRDGQLVTSRKPDDIPAFNQKIIELFAEHHQKS